jgi:hypothetical protein
LKKIILNSQFSILNSQFSISSCSLRLCGKINQLINYLVNIFKMKRIYKNLFLAAAGLLVAGSMNAAGDLSINVIGFSSTTVNPNPSAPGTHSEVSITFTGATQETSTGVTVAGSSVTGLLSIAKSGTITITRPAVANDVITNVVLWGGTASGTTSLNPEVSIFADPAVWLPDISDWGALRFAAIDASNAAYSLTVVNAMTLGEDYDITPADLVEAHELYDPEIGGLSVAPSAIQHIRFTVTSATALKLFGIQVYTIQTPVSTGVQPVVAAKTPVKSTYYDLTGKIVSSDAKGFIIRKTVYSDGSVNGEKTYNR